MTLACDPMNAQHPASMADDPATAVDGRPQPPAGQPLNRPVRGIVAAAEVAVAGALVLVAVWVWSRATVPVELTPAENPAIPRFATRMSGTWAAAAVGAGLLAGLCLLDAVRQAMLALRTRSAE